MEGSVTGKSREIRRNRPEKALEKALPAIFFFYVFFLYFSLLSTAYFTDEQDVFYGAYSVVKGRDIYLSYISQHMPFSYYFAAIPALLGARTVFQFRLAFYVMLSVLWLGIFLRHRRFFHPVALFFMPALYLAALKTLPVGTTMLTDHWQGIGLTLIMLELIRYAEDREISLTRAAAVSLGVVLSFGCAFGAAYSLMCYFLGMVAIQVKLLRQERMSRTGRSPDELPRSGGPRPEPSRKKNRKPRKHLRENVRLAVVCLLPFAIVVGWYALSGNLLNFYEGAYGMVTKVYSRYTGGLGSDPVSVVWTTVLDFGKYLGTTVRDLPAAPGKSILYLLSAAGLLLCGFRLGKRSPAAGVMLVLAAVYGGLRGFFSFHTAPYYGPATASLALCAGWGLERVRNRTEQTGSKRLRRAALGLTGVAAAALLADFVVWAGYNLLYPQILLPRTLRSEQRILDLLTDPDEVVFPCNLQINSLDVMDLELVPKEACGVIGYPYDWEYWSDRAMVSIRDLPNVVLYNPEEDIHGWVFGEYATEFDAFMRENYTKLGAAEEIWVSNSFLPEASRRLEAEGYGDLLVSNTADLQAGSPVEYTAGQSVKAVFTAAGADLTAVRIRGARFFRRSDPALTLRLREAGGETVLAEASMAADQLCDDFFSRCPMRARLVPGQAFELEIVIDRIGGKGDMEFYFLPDGDLALMTEYRTDSGRTDGPERR